MSCRSIAQTIRPAQQQDTQGAPHGDACQRGWRSALLQPRQDRQGHRHADQEQKGSIATTVLPRSASMEARRFMQGKKMKAQKHRDTSPFQGEEGRG